MIRHIIVPTGNTFILHLPDDLIGKEVEVIAFSTEDTPSSAGISHVSPKKTLAEVLDFYKKNSVDFTTIEKWNREDLYE